MSKEEREKAKRVCYGIIYGELIFVIGTLSLSWECRDAVWMCYGIVYSELSCCTIYGELCLRCGEHCPGLQRCCWGCAAASPMGSLVASSTVNCLVKL